MEKNNSNKNKWKNRKINNQNRKGRNMNKKIIDTVLYSVEGKRSRLRVSIANLLLTFGFCLSGIKLRYVI